MSTIHQNEHGLFIVIVGPSGGGKSTFLAQLLDELPYLTKSISFTSRKMRPGEENGKDYFFLDDKEFQKKIKNKEFIEWALVHDHYYGTSRQFIEDSLSLGQIIITDLDIQGADTIKEYFKDHAKVIFIAPPSLEVLSERLLNRKTDSNEVIAKRLKNAEAELKRQDDFDFLVINNEKSESFKKLKNIIIDLVKKR